MIEENLVMISLYGLWKMVANTFRILYTTGMFICYVLHTWATSYGILYTHYMHSCIFIDDECTFSSNNEVCYVALNQVIRALETGTLTFFIPGLRRRVLRQKQMMISFEKEENVQVSCVLWKLERVHQGNMCQKMHMRVQECTRCVCKICKMCVQDMRARVRVRVRYRCACVCV
jgi:hypothetical protein